jgi:hypothetical protein
MRSKTETSIAVAPRCTATRTAAGRDVDAEREIARGARARARDARAAADVQHRRMREIQDRPSAAVSGQRHAIASTATLQARIIATIITPSRVG